MKKLLLAIVVIAVFSGMIESCTKKKILTPDPIVQRDIDSGYTIITPKK